MKRILAFSLFVFATIVANAFTLSGKIKTISNEPLPYVSVYLKDVHMGTTTDLDGNYKLSGIPEGKHTIVVSYVGYKSQAFDIDLQKDGYRDFIMEEDAITLDEVFITPNGESIQRFILNQTVKNYKSMSKYVDSFTGDKHIYFEQRNNNMKILVEPYMKYLNPLLSLVGLKKLFVILKDNPNLRVEFKLAQTCKKGIYTTGDAKVVSCSPKFTEREDMTLERFFGRMNCTNVYEDIYSSVKSTKKDLDKAVKKNPDAEKKLKYIGAYHDCKSTVHIIQYGRFQYHIIDGIWQVRRYVKFDKDKKDMVTKSIETHEFAKEFYMPVSIMSEIDLNLITDESIKKWKEEDTSKMSKKELETHNKTIKSMEEYLSKGESSLKTSTSITYQNFKMK